MLASEQSRGIPSSAGEGPFTNYEFVRVLCSIPPDGEHHGQYLPLGVEPGTGLATRPLQRSQVEILDPVHPLYPDCPLESLTRDVLHLPVAGLVDVLGPQGGAVARALDYPQEGEARKRPLVEPELYFCSP